MRKQTKIAAVASAAALLAIGASMTAFAAGWTQQEDGTWVCVDNDGDPMEGFYRWSDGKEYYADENGDLVTHQIVEDDGYYFYVDGSGAKARNRWVNIPNDEGFELDNGDIPDSFWYYVQQNGRILTAGESMKQAAPLSEKDRTKKGYFVFDDYGHMLTGWQQVDSALLYCYPEGTEGKVAGQVAEKTWLDLAELSELTDDLDAILSDLDNDEDGDGKVWIYMDEGGALFNPESVEDPTTWVDTKNDITYTQKKIGNNYYYFNPDGVLVEEAWMGTKYVGADGVVKSKNAWHHADGDDDTWYYMDNNYDAVGKNNGDKQYTPRYISRAYYVFGKGGVMVTDTVIARNAKDVKVTTGTNASSLDTYDAFYVDENGKLVMNGKVGNGYALKKGKMAADDIAIINGYVYVLKDGYSQLVTTDYEDYTVVTIGKSGVKCYKKDGTSSTVSEAYKEGVQLLVKSNGALAKNKGSAVYAEDDANPNSEAKQYTSDSNGIAKVKE